MKEDWFCAISLPVETKKTVTMEGPTPEDTNAFLRETGAIGFGHTDIVNASKQTSTPPSAGEHTKRINTFFGIH